MRTKNAKMRIIKWEIVWNNNREDKNGEGEREQWMIYVAIVSQTTKQGFETQTVYWIVKRRCSRFLRLNWGWTEVKPWWRHN